MADHLGASLAVAALTMALAARRPPWGSLVHHSDRGVQYACAEYTRLLDAHGIAASMSRVGNPYDNAKAERFIRTLKSEEIDGTRYRDHRDAADHLGAFIDQVYNRQRLHSALDYSDARRVRGRAPSALPRHRASHHGGFSRDTEIYGDARCPTDAMNADAGEDRPPAAAASP
jgi:putative transposase